MGHSFDRRIGPFWLAGMAADCGPAWQQRPGPWSGAGAWEGHHHRRGGGPGGPPPWLAGLLGMGRPDSGRGPRVRRGDVRSAILDVLRVANEREESPNGYQVIQQITERSGGAWSPSPGSVYPTIQQLEDEGLVETDEGRGRRALRLTDAGASYCNENADELAAVWAPFERAESAWSGEHADIKAEIPQVMSAVWQIVTSGDEAQRRAAVEVLVEARRKLYGILADGPAPEEPTEER
jgi:DNA-binding PadR family transcriptional regulator